MIYLKKHYRIVILFGALIWIVSNLHHPITPTLFLDLKLPSHIFGTSYAAMVFGMFLTSPIWGSLGDKYGRTKIIYLSPLLYSLGQIGLAFSTTIPTITLFRFISGSSAGGFNVGLMSAIVDNTTQENRGIVMGRYSAVMGISTSVGYLIGGLLGYFLPRIVLLIQATLMLGIGIGMRVFLKSTKEVTRDTKITFVWDLFRDVRMSKEMFTPWIIIFLVVTFFGAIGDNVNVNATNFYMKEHLNLKPVVNGAWKSVTGIVGFIANLTINVWILEKSNIRKSLVFILILSTLGGFIIFFNNELYLFFIMNLILVTLYTMQVPILQHFAVEGNPEYVGLMSGIYNATKSFGAMFGSIITGLSYYYNSKFPFLIGAIAFGIGSIFGVINLKRENLKGGKYEKKIK